MKYDFTTYLDRSHKDSTAWDAVPAPDKSGKFNIVPKDKALIKEGFDAIPMWVADMNFVCCPAVTRSIADRLAHPSFGYFPASDAYYESIIDWHKSRKDMDITREDIGYENGVLGGVISALNVFCSKGDNVLVHSPTYIGFTKALSNNGYHIVHSPMKKVDGTWRIDFDDMEKKIVENKIHAMIWCSPHNPTGRVWEREELEKMAEIAEKHDVKIVSDEIWSDIILPGYRHIPTQNINEWTKNNTVALYAPSKTFSLAGLVGSYHVIRNKTLKDRIDKESSLSHYNEMNVLSMHALIGGFSPEGQEWVGQLNEVIDENVDIAMETVERIDGISAARPQGTYMLFVDCEDWCKEHNVSLDDVLAAGIEHGIIWQDGRMFHGPYAIRLNLALPTNKVREAFDRMEKYVFVKK